MTVSAWGLEVVRGREAGRTYRLEAASTVLGNALAGAKGIDLAEQEPDSPRRMAARQAVIEAEPKLEKIVLRDLDSPGGTFVNRQRLLPGQGRALIAGDLIQIGAVQLKVVRNGIEAAHAPVASSSTNIINYQLGDGTTCRSWDDFLKVASQKWAILREELTSGRVDAWLRSIGRTDLLVTSGVGDDRLDQWLARLPLTTPARPELDVHPKSLTIRVTPGGGQTTRSVSVANVGHRLLKITARIDPTTSSWLRVGKEMSDQPRTVVDSFELLLEIAIPETLPHPLRASVVIDSNGGCQRVEVVLEAKTAADLPPTAGDYSSVDAGGSIRARLAAIPLALRIAALVLVAIVARLIVFAACRLIPSAGESPALLGPATAFFALGAVAGGAFTYRRGGKSQIAYGAISGGLAGAATSAVLVATCRSIEPLLGSFGQSLLGASLIWGLLGTVFALLSTVLVPYVGPSKAV